MEKRLVPEIRFKGFKGDWEEKRFKDYVKLSQGLQIPVAERLVKETPDSLFYITNEFLNPNSKVKYYIKNAKDNVKAHKDDILMTRTGNTGKVITDIEGVFHNNFFKVAYEKQKTEKYFLYHLLKSPKIQKEILVRAGTSTIPDLNHGDFYGIKHYIPEKGEQEKIGRLFESLDQTIDLQGKVVEENKRLKQALLQKLFPKKDQKLPELRLKGFSGDWAEKKIENLLSKSGSGGTPKSTEPKFYNGDIPFLSITDITNSNGVIRETEKRITKLGLENSTAWIVPSGSISLAMYASVGKVAKLGVDSATSQAFFNMIVSENTDVEYLFQFLKFLELTNGWRKLISTGTQPNLNAKKIREFKIPIPSLPEQEAIGKLFKSLDDKIQREEERLKGYKTLKKSLLQKMFV